MAIADSTKDFRLGDVEIYPDQSFVRTAAGERHIEPKVMAVLLRLAAEPMAVVGRADLLNSVWAGTVVTDEVVTRCISELRQALGDTTKAPKYIRTIPKKGYKLLLAPEPLEPAALAAASAGETPAGTAAAPAARAPRNRWLVASAMLGALALCALVWQQWQPAAAPAVQTLAAETETLSDATEPAVAVLPFATLGGGSEADYFGAGLAEELVNALVNVPGLRVASHTAASSADAGSDAVEIAQALGVDVVLTGSVRRLDERVRVSAQLVNGADGFHLWADQFEGDLQDVFSIQDDIAAAIVTALQLKLTEPVRVARISSDIDALDYYLLGRHHWHQRTATSLNRAIELFKQAVATDPEMAIAYSGLADAYLLLADYGDFDHEQARELARPAVAKALQLDPQLAEAHASEGMLYLSDGDPQAAQRAFEEAVRLNPAYHMALMWLGSSVAMQGQVRKAHDYYLRAYKLDPLHPVINQNVAASFASLGDYARAFRVLDKFDPRYDGTGRLTELELMLAEQLGDFDRIERLAGGILATADTPLDMRTVGYRALWAMHTRRAESDAAARYLELARTDGDLSYDFIYRLAQHHAKAGESEEFRAVLRGAPQEVREKLQPHQQPLEGLLQLVTERYDEAAASFEAALGTPSPKAKKHPVGDLYMVSHLLIAYRELGNDERVAYWHGEGESIIRTAQRNGVGQFDFLLQSAYFHGASGNAEAAAKTFWQALTLGKLAPWELTEDTRLYGVLQDKKLQPLLAEAARTWPA